MKRIRINNDIRIQWNIEQNGGDIDLTTFTSVVELLDPNGRKCQIDTTVKEDYILVTFHAKDQHALGDYTLVLKLQLSSNSAVTTDYLNAFTLVAHSCDESEDEDDSPVEITTMELESEVFLDTAVLIQQFEEVKEQVDDLDDKVDELDSAVTAANTDRATVKQNLQSVTNRVTALETTTVVDTTTRKTDMALSNTNLVIARVGLSSISKPIAIPANTTFKLSNIGTSKVFVCEPTPITVGKDMTSYIMTTITASNNPQTITYNKEVMIIERGDYVGALKITIQDDASALWGLVDAQVNLAMLEVKARLDALETQG